MPSYDYRQQRHYVFSEEGQPVFLKVRDRAHKLIAEAGVARMDAITRGSGAVTNWYELACVDRLVELGEIEEIPNTISSAGQHRIFSSIQSMRPD